MNIDIDIRDNQSFGIIAALVDQGEFLQDIRAVRDKFGIDPNKYPNHFTRDLEVISEEKKNNFNSRTQQLLIKFKNNVHDKKYISERTKLFRQLSESEDLHYTLIDIRKKYRRPVHFLSVIEAAVYKNSVNEDDYFPGSAIPLWGHLQPSGDEYGDEDYESEVLLTIYPETRKQDVLKLWQLAKAYFKDDTGRVPIPKVKTKIKVHRNIYWFYKDHLESRKQIIWEDAFMEWKELCPIYSSGNNHSTNDSCIYCDNMTKFEDRTFRSAVFDYIDWLKLVR